MRERTKPVRSTFFNVQTLIVLIFWYPVFCLFFIAFPPLSHFLFPVVTTTLWLYIIVQQISNHLWDIHIFTVRVSTCCIVLVVVDEFWDAAEIVLLCQVKLALCGGADVIMSAASTSVPVERNGRVTSCRFSRMFSSTQGICPCVMYIWYDIFSALSTDSSVLQNDAMKKFCRQISPGFA